MKLLKEINSDQCGNPGDKVKVTLWRTGDAEYSFTSDIKDINRKERSIKLSYPEKLIKNTDLRSPYISAIIPCAITISSDNPEEEPVKIDGTIDRINTEEIVIISSSKLGFKDNISISFILSEFTVSSEARILSDKTISASNIYYYTLKFVSLSNAARTIIKKFILDHTQ